MHTQTGKDETMFFIMWNIQRKTSKLSFISILSWWYQDHTHEGGLHAAVIPGLARSDQKVLTPLQTDPTEAD